MASFINQRWGISRYEADEYYRRALEAYRKRAFDDAVDAMNDAIEALPTKSEYYAARGLILLEDGELERARADFETALHYFRYEMLAHYGLGALAYKAGKFDEAIRHFMQAYFIDTERAETLYYLALSHYRRGDLAAAIDFMVRANDRLEQANDRRKADAARWLREFAKHVAQGSKQHLSGRLAGQMPLLPGDEGQS